MGINVNLMLIMVRVILRRIHNKLLYLFFGVEMYSEEIWIGLVN